MKMTVGLRLMGALFSLLWLAGCGVAAFPASSDAAADGAPVISAPAAENDASLTAENEPAPSAESRPASSAEIDAENPTFAAENNAEIPAFTKEDFLRVYSEGYLFFREASIEHFAGADFEDQRTEGGEQWIALPEFSSKEDFLDRFDPYFTAAFMEKWIAPWFDGRDEVGTQLREFDGKLYYRSTDGDGITGPFDLDAVTFEQAGPGTVVCTCPDYDPQMQRTLEGGAILTMVYDNGLWRLDQLEYYYNPPLE